MDTEYVMKFKSLIKMSSICCVVIIFTCTGCSDDNHHAFLFGCVRPEQVTQEISVVGITSINKKNIENELRQIDGFVSCLISEEKNSIRVVYNSSATRYMNIERILLHNDVAILKRTRLNK